MYYRKCRCLHISVVLHCIFCRFYTAGLHTVNEKNEQTKKKKKKQEAMVLYQKILTAIVNFTSAQAWPRGYSVQDGG